MNLRILIPLLFGTLLSFVSFGQQDSNRLLSFEDYMLRVKTHHPLAIQANLQKQKGDASVLQARGGFDPKAFADVAQKYFDDKQYYSVADGGLKIPTWFGLEIKGGYEQNQGVFLNPENTTPGTGLWYAGLSLPIGQGLFIDERRAELKQAQLYRESTAAMQNAMMNELLYMAGKTYWDWFMAYNSLKVYEEAYQLAIQRFEGVKQSASLGDKPAIDTLEAGIQVQNRQLGLQQAQLEFANTTALLSVYLWDEGMIPLEVAEGTIPQSANALEPLSVQPAMYLLLDSLVTGHPELVQYQFKIEQLEIEKRWKKEQLKPIVNLNYNALTEAIQENPLAEYSPNNYKWGVSFSMPILLRKERGAVRLADLKIQEAELDIASKTATLGYKAIASLNEWSNTADQVVLYTRTVRDYNGLLNGERQMFEGGESSLFMVNSRELGYINAQLKLIELLAKNRKASLATSYSLGILN